MQEYDTLTINKLILTKHHLTNASKTNDIVNITEDLCGLHASGTIEPYIQLFIRANDFKKEKLDTELYTKRNLGKIRGMRKTLFIFTKDLMQIVYPFVRNLTLDREQKYLEYRDISSEEYDMLSQKVLNLLKKEELSTQEIKQKINSKKDLVAVISVMCDQMLLIRGKPVSSWRDRRLMYAPFKTYFPTLNLSMYTEKEALNFLIKRYITSYGPVTVEDIAWWSGLTKTKIKTILANLEPELIPIRISNVEHEYFLSPSDLKLLENLSPQSNAILLPLLDPYMMGYKNRERYVEINNYEYIFDRSGNATQVILRDGFVIGIWDIILKPKPVFKLYFFVDVDQITFKEITLKAKELARFITGKELKIDICESMIPLTEKTMGGFMSPLKSF
jgi:hypothetical protein